MPIPGPYVQVRIPDGGVEAATLHTIARAYNISVGTVGAVVLRHLATVAHAGTTDPYYDLARYSAVQPGYEMDHWGVAWRKIFDDVFPDDLTADLHAARDATREMRKQRGRKGGTAQRRTNDAADET